MPKRRSISFVIFLVVVMGFSAATPSPFALCLVAQDTDVPIHEVSIEPIVPPEPWPEGVRIVDIASTADGSLQKALFEPASRLEARPLLVALHSWSGDYLQRSGIDYLEQCRKRAWHFIHPDFRGVNQTPQAVCSDLAVTDILDAVVFAKANANVDATRVYLVGASGGGMAALHMLAKAPEVWAGVSAWVPISDLSAWHKETALRRLKYTAMIESACGGPPGANAAVDFQYRNRSPLIFLNSSIQTPLDLNAGIHDGHSGSVPISHSLHAFNALAEPGDRIDDSLIEAWEKSASIPIEWQWKNVDPAYEGKPVLFRRQSNDARLTLFEGGHEIIPEAAFIWLEKQKRTLPAAMERPL